MEPRTLERSPERPAVLAPDADRPAEDSSSPLLDVLRALWQGRQLLVGAVFFAGIVGIVISLLLPVWYRASTRVLLPDGLLSGGLSSLIGDLSPAASALLGGGSSDYSRYLAILTSNTVTMATIDEFDLIEVYGYEDDKYALERTAKELTSNIDFEVDLEFDYLEIAVFDQDPERAAALANYLVDRLNQVNAELAAQDASNFRRYVERRYNESLAELDSACNALQSLQETYGVIELPTMAEVYMESIAQQRAQAVQGEIEYEALLRQLGPANPQVQAAREFVAAAQRKERELLSGRDLLLPVAKDDLPALANEYARIYQDVLIETEVLKSVRPLYEQARFEEEREKTAVQVLDTATTPDRKAKPKRAVFVIVFTMSIGLLTVLFILGRVWINRHGIAVARALNRGD